LIQVFDKIAVEPAFIRNMFRKAPRKIFAVRTAEKIRIEMAKDSQKVRILFVMVSGGMSRYKEPDDTLHISGVVFQIMRTDQKRRAVIRQNVAEKIAFPFQTDSVMLFCVFP
jgi:hypothetical protein